MERELRNSIEGEVRFDAGSRALYATDGSNYRQVPIGVVVPKSKQDVERTVAVSRKFGAPILSRGGGTSLAGQCCNVAVVMPSMVRAGLITAALLTAGALGFDLVQEKSLKSAA